ncbi:MAG TPA: RNA 3'-terminal phosphate cyclase [Candidatus Korarchaeota archaeon]|nr:RNA 3'-terminal phosphate cyclase [Candidatus Korarchaeota archaeon]
MDLVKIDGSYGEGGGSILRYALSLSAATMKPVEVLNIRAKRKKPGLRPQHLNAVRALAKLTNADVEGDFVGSKRVFFIPKSKRGGTFKVDIGTAGSVSLIIQALLPASITAEGEVRFLIKGGTDVPMAPPIDYMREVFLPNIALMGVRAEIRLLRRGHYPKGGGIVELRVLPSKLRPLVKINRDDIRVIRGRAHAVRLPQHVVRRIAKSATQILEERGFQVEVDEEWSENSHLGPGAGIVLWTDSSPIIGSDELGERGKPSEVVGKNAALKILREIDTKMALDHHSGDMIIPYLAMASGKSRVGISKLTMHAESNIWLVEKFLPVKFLVEGGLDRPSIVGVEGVGV